MTTSEFIITEGKRGAAIGYRPMYKTTRVAYCTDAFKEKHPVVVDILKTTSAKPGNRWRWLQGVAEVEATAARFKGKRDAELVVFASEFEVKRRPQAPVHV